MRAPNPASSWGGIALACCLALACGGLHAADKPAPAKQKLVCVNDAATGSHIRKRSCVTEEEAAARRKRDQEAMANMRQKTAPQASSPGK